MSSGPAFISRLIWVPLLILILTSFQTVAALDVCPGSSASVHAKCDMTVEFPNVPCDTVLEEILLRLQQQSSTTWRDPHNGGTYELLKQLTIRTTTSTTTKLSISRTTGDGLYTDLMGLEASPQDTQQGCTLQACSESQVFSILDYSTNFCNLRNLYAGDDNQEYVQHSFVEHDDYTVRYKSCRQRDATKCVVETEET